MSTTRSAAVLASGTANAAKLFVAALAFTSAYVGFSAYSSASSTPEPARTVSLSAQEVPITERLSAQAGKVTVSVLADGGAGCAKSYVARSVVLNPDPAQGMAYGWRLSRWSSATKSWRTYLVDHDGFAGAARTVEWRPQITGNPGWYRVELTAEDAKTVKSDRFQVSC
ncbi:hypothetical protein ETD86_23785 [Nonomuraea turkmeniaca]|uniref:Secreted protein n=1 Tax=Nonomuraea turkmeniaca TaxID=103838 RepID=A0A5S4FEP4_9ACTN|nr:hypothetical protein [Nonomuraea turkmeniaca]TMR17077.1 hypothetical protein ETD86_23785 [Nonomuraea turkmeniaca]